MPSDRLTEPVLKALGATPQQMANGVLAVLAGTPVHAAATTIGVAVTDLAEAIELYTTAGQTALQAQAESDWYHVRIQFPDWDTAEQSAASVLGPRLRHLQHRGVVTGWWFIRKHPYWRLRLHHGLDVAPADMKATVDSTLNELTASKMISHWWQTIYEPEPAAFGGPAGMAIAHELFCADSDHILRYLHQPEPAIGRRELSILLCTVLFRGAQLDSFERGDVWHRVTTLRPLPSGAPIRRFDDLAAALRTLVTIPTDFTEELFAPDEPLAFAQPWVTAFDRTGKALNEAAATGHLDRGIRHILTHLVIFHWNRLGLSATTQAVLAHAAKEAVIPHN